ncbi:tetratricopeptide repeat protein [Myxococcus landrumensis]|uniref:Tetratricopeptide repeat protein n=1 Tax=Myxococcus landrumensis TaxID=2813577 RepID=A0ABX7NCS5_9BACT|nr:tetratricopeptide repeat protein [Myxococcus landrumus]QSQ16601.1 tetratricopeptide repeat protein [Myxococcus landrumus]
MVFVRKSVIALSAVLLLGAAEPSESARASFVRGESALSSGRLEQAAAAYREALSATPGYAAALNGLGSVLFRQGQMKDAIARFQEATEADPEHKMAFFNLGYAARKVSDWATAARAYSRYVELEPADADGYYGLAESHRLLGDRTQAIAAYQGYILREKRPAEQVWVQKARGHLKALGGEPLPANAQVVDSRRIAAPVSTAASTPAVMTPVAAVKETTPAVAVASTPETREKSNTPAPATTTGGAPQDVERPQEPIPFPSTRAASEPSPERTPNPALAAARIRDGDALMKERRYREAAFAFLDASHADSGHVEALFKLGNALAVLGYYGQAVEKWESVSRLTQDATIRQSAQDNITRARAKQAQAGTSPQAAGLAPGSGPVADTTRAQARRAYEQGVQRIGAKDFTTALTHLSQAIQLEPMLAVAYTARGSANIGLRRYAEAAADYQFALELEPQSASPLYGLAESYRALGRNAEARGLYERYAASSAADVRPQLQEESRQKASKLR